jgi:AcrR family transcriptional regulator
MTQQAPHSEKADKRDLILDAAQALFAAQGYTGTSVRDICQQAGVNVAMVNYYFGSKEGLFEKMVERKASVMRGRLEELAGNKELSSMGKIETLVEEFIARMFGHRDFTLTIMREMSKSGDQDLRQRLASIFTRNMSVLKSIIEEGMRSGEFKQVDAVLTISTIYGTIWNLISTEVMLKLIDPSLMGTENLYGDPKFQERVIEHLRSLLRSHLLKA